MTGKGNVNHHPGGVRGSGPTQCIRTNGESLRRKLTVRASKKVQDHDLIAGSITITLDKRMKK